MYSKPFLSLSLIAALSGCGGGYVTQMRTEAPSLPVSGPALGRLLHGKPSGASADWDSFGYDLQRTGYNPLETVVGPGNVGAMQKRWSVNVGEQPAPEPVLASGVMVGGHSTNVLYTGSNHGAMLEAFNAQTGALIWQQKIASLTFTCGGKSREWAMGATPAIDRANNRIYVGDGILQVHAFDLSTGKEDAGWPLVLATFQTGHNNMHGGLTYNPSNGMLYAVTSSTCDWTPWRGRIAAIDTTVPKIVKTFYTVTRPDKAQGGGGGIWGGGGGSIDPATNDVLIATGNADTSVGLAQNAGYAENIVMFSPDLSTVVASNYPANIPHMEGVNDLDFGSTPVIFTPPGCPEMAAALNKSGMFELYDVSTISEGPVQYVQMSITSDQGDFQGEVVYDPDTNYLYIGLPATYGSYLPGLGAFGFTSNCTIDPTPAWSANFGPDGSTTSGGTPRSAVTAANGVVYVSNWTGRTEFAFNAQTGAQLWTTRLAGNGKPGTIVANGIVYVMDNSGNLTAWAPPSQDSVPVLRQLVEPKVKPLNRQL